MVQLYEYREVSLKSCWELGEAAAGARAPKCVATAATAALAAAARVSANHFRKTIDSIFTVNRREFTTVLQDYIIHISHREQSVVDSIFEGNTR